MVNTEKEKLLYNSGVTLFGKFGVKRVSIDMIVTDAGVAKGTFYLYFKNKEALYEQIIDDIIGKGKIFMESLVKNIPDVQERLYMHMIGTLGFFEENGIIKNLIDGNEDYFLGKINPEYLYKNHVKFMSILLGDDFKNEDFTYLVSNVKGFFLNSVSKKKCCLNKDDYDDFVMNLAAVMISGLFSDYKKIRGNKSFKEITNYVQQYKI